MFYVDDGILGVLKSQIIVTMDRFTQTVSIFKINNTQWKKNEKNWTMFGAEKGLYLKKCSVLNNISSSSWRDLHIWIVRTIYRHIVS